MIVAHAACTVENGCCGALTGVLNTMLADRQPSCLSILQPTNLKTDICFNILGIMLAQVNGAGSMEEVFAKIDGLLSVYTAAGV